MRTKRTLRRYTAASLAAIIALLCPVIGDARAAATDYAQTLNGGLSGPLCSSAGVAKGNAAGDLPGSFELSIDCSEGEVTGGMWRIAVKVANADGTESERGQVTGRIVGGAVSVNGTVMTGSGVAVAVTGGTGYYAAVTDGTGTLEFTADTTGSPQFQATLRLSF